MHTKIVSITNRVWLLAGLAFVASILSVSTLTAATLLTETFNVGTTTQSNTNFWWVNNSNEANKPTSAQLNYWKSSNDGTNLGMGLNGPNWSNAFINQRGNTDLAKQVWWLRDLRDGPVGGGDFSSTHGSSATRLGADEAFINPSFSGTLYYTYGSNSTVSTDIDVTYSLSLLNEVGNGYVATINSTNGVVSFYRLDYGITGDWGAALASTAATARLDNTIPATFSISDGLLKLTSTTGLSLTFTDKTYSEFTTIGFAGLLENDRSPYIRIRAVSLTGEISAIPEPSTYAALAAFITLVVAFVARRYSTRT